MIGHNIKSIKGREILDSRGYPTIEVALATESGIYIASVPSGTSTGKYEAKELRDGGDRYLGLGVQKAIENINQIIAPALCGKNPQEQQEIDNLMIKLDGTPDKSKLGANAILGVSIAVLRAGAGAEGVPLWQWIAEIAKTKPLLPFPCLLYVEGGVHGRGNVDAQEFMVTLEDDSFHEQLRLGTETYHALREILNKKLGKASTNVGLEGGFTPPVQETEDVLDLIMEATKKNGAKNLKIIIDMAAGTFFKNDRYYFEGESFDQKDLTIFYTKLCQKYPIAGIEDPFAEDDWVGFKGITQNLGQKINIIGDDLLATNIQRIQEAQKNGACNALILKPNQAGTVSETVKAAKLALEHNWDVFVKHRSGETCDTFLADLAVGLGTGFLMAGAPNRGERVAKYNRVLMIEQEWQNYYC
ncbi:MAG: phosphopyruvate hydratase [Candidatus Nealsonbacteria bacterium RIFCSPHIGHO2_01_FULL_43_31]|uniref:Enolase n=2 Tax=Candidatus Nealsoniibacteriota TaxID=1817911 RepID=A0A1G2E649_9BACT|nr:MAG: phosphopyruvate hydratase [Candidatus Nealsonbacteria bacterium RIFCSPHIGHO2_01_FULL_43_31]OGZ21326.1 MAG: phosphopyruvate hydratase [Candidatus Nealsonbacteria bacterium RIFCSPHIGHO2_02_FULL_43_13]OGZ24218.1 MAG: phosphopyruvate hydratase [Candidatus Nealsonbacteria bacterium RIFCSPLOWO2_01_FULL_43_36]